MDLGIFSGNRVWSRMGDDYLASRRKLVEAVKRWHVAGSVAVPAASCLVHTQEALPLIAVSACM